MAGETNSSVRRRRASSTKKKRSSRSRSRGRTSSPTTTTTRASTPSSRGRTPDTPLLRVYDEHTDDEDDDEVNETVRLSFEQKRAARKAAKRAVLLDCANDIHTVSMSSPLDSTVAQSQNYRGLLNLAFTILFVSQVRLVVENLMKYGILFATVPSLDSGLLFWMKTWPCFLTALILLPLQPVLAHLIEYGLPNTVAPGVKDALHIAHAAAGIAIPTVVIEVSNAAHVSGVALLLLTTCGVLKLCSYAHVMHCTREQSNPPVAPLSQVFYFFAAPTLCFQFSYPRFPARIRKRFLFKRCAELAFCSVLIFIIARQYVEITLWNAMKYMRGGDWNYVGILERVIKVCVPYLIMFLVGFYALFHSWLNITAELLRFGDRVFYKDWWNATNIKDYWQRWNTPVHNFVLRHLYAPLMRRNVNVNVAQFVVFLLSAALHEYIVSVPMHSIKLWAFFGMLLQAPLVSFGSMIQKLFGKQSVVGNVIFWSTFCVFGQPLIILLYYHDAMKTQFQ